MGDVRRIEFTKRELAVMQLQWWETLTEGGLPRFYIFCSAPATLVKKYQGTYQHINVVELKPTTKNLPRSVRSAGVKQVLLHTVPLHLDTQGRRVWERAERVVSKLNSMTLSVLAHENERKGISELFAHLWSEDVENNSC
jgi:hypothetical protein